MKELKEKAKALLRKAEVKGAAVASVAAVAMTGLASAAEGDPVSSSSTVITAFQTGFQQMATDALGMLAIIVPIAIGVAGTVYLSRKAISWFKSIAK